MTEKINSTGQAERLLEIKKRRREKIYIFLLGALFLILTWIEFRLFGMSENLPIQHSIFFFGLVNFNIILFLFVMFLIFRNIVKNFAEREGGPLGSSLKSKLIAAFVGFSFVPTALMFTISVFYINNSFDRWFNEKTSGVLKSSLEVTNSYYQTAKRKNYHFAELIASELKPSASTKSLQTQLDQVRKKFALDIVEFYPTLLDPQITSVATTEGVPSPPAVSLEVLKKAIDDRSETSTIHHFSGGDLIRVLVPVNSDQGQGVVIVSSYVPLSLISKMDDIASAYENFRDTDPLAYPIKSIYLIILVLMSLVILLGATWFGFYLARQLSIPLEELVQATQRVVKGDYQKVVEPSGSPEINRLIQNFNKMTHFLGRSERDLMEANQSLRKTLGQLDEHSRYIEVVLTRVTTGVISIDQEDRVTMINRHAERLLHINGRSVLGKKVNEALSPEHYKIFFGLMEMMKANRAETVEKEVQVAVKGKPLLLEMTLTMLFDEKGRELGKVLVFDDLSLVLAAQRAAAWTEVARRIAHEIKNPLTPISLAAQRLQRKFGDSITDPAFKDCTDMIVDQVDGLKNLVNEFSQFARMPKIKPTIGDLNKVVDEALRLFMQTDRNFTIQFKGSPDLPSFLFDSDHIKRIVTNLIDNAAESLSKKTDGQIDVEVQYDPSVRIARLLVADNGEGIPKFMKERIFEPYMTTKKHGTGLGLAIVKRAVEDHSGFIRAFDNPGGGTRFVIELPVNLSNTSVSTFVADVDDQLDDQIRDV